MFGYDAQVKPYPYDPERAKRLLAEAGQAQGLTLTLNSPNGRYIKDKEVAEAISGQLQKFGARSKWLMSHRQRAAHHVPTGAEAFAPRTPDT